MGTIVPSYAECLAASGHDPFVRWHVSAVEGHVLDGAVAFDWRGTLTVVGAPAAAARGVRQLVPVGAPTRVTVPRGTLALLPGLRVGDGADWEWMRADVRPGAAAAAHRVVPLSDGAEISTLLEVASPRHSADPGDDDVVQWVGVRSGAGGLLACAAHTEAVPGVPHLASIATHPDARGQGLGELVTRTLTDQLLEAGSPVVTLGMYSDNDVARRLYARLGFRCDHRWSSYVILRH